MPDSKVLQNKSTYLYLPIEQHHFNDLELHWFLATVFLVDEPGEMSATVTVQIDDEESTVRFVDDQRVEVAHRTDDSTCWLPTVTLYSAKAIMVPHRIIWSWYTGRWWVGCYIWYSDEETGHGRRTLRPLLTVPNITAHPLTASVPITVLLYNGPLFCDYNVSLKG